MPTRIRHTTIKVRKTVEYITGMLVQDSEKPLLYIQHATTILAYYSYFPLPDSPSAYQYAYGNPDIAAKLTP
jgi:hypothetical protein